MTITTEQLLQHSQWAKSLAHHLVGDAAAAEDLVQDAWMAALQSPPPEGAIRPWLGGVIRNLALLGRRTAGRRHASEKAVSKAEALPSTAELVEQAEAQRDLVDAVLALSEPYRSVVILRYYENKSSAEIARDRRVPSGTVRSQLHEGLAKLRGILDSQHGGDRRAWCVALLPLARVDLLKTAGTSSSFVGGLLVMKTIKVTAVLGAAALLMVLLISFLQKQPEDRGGSPTEIANVGSAQEILETGTTEEPSRKVVSLGNRREIPVSKPEAVIAYRIRIRFVDSDGRPIPKVRTVFRRGGYLTSELDPQASVSDAKGVATVVIRTASVSDDAVDPNALGRLRVIGRASCPGLANQLLVGDMFENQVLDFGDVEMVRGGSIDGHVLLESGAPAIHAEVLVLAAGRIGYAKATTDSDGKFHLEGVRLGTVKVRAKVDEFSEGTSSSIVRPGHKTPELTIRVRNRVPLRNRIRGVVLDSKGNPVPHAGVLGSTQRSYRAGRLGSVGGTADAAGVFETKAMSRDAHQVLVFDVKNRWRVDHESQVMPGTVHEFRLREPGQMRIVACDLQGRKVPGARVYVQHAGWPEYSFHPHGGLAVNGMDFIPMPRIPFTVRVIAPGYQVQLVGPFQPETLSGNIPIIPCQLIPAPFVSGVVLADRVPVAGAAVRVHGPAQQRVTKHGFPTTVDLNPRAQAITDAEGRFKLSLQQRLSFRLLVSKKGYALGDSGVLPPSRLGDRSGIRITLGRGGTIAGRAIGGPVLAGPRPIVAISRGDGVVRHQRVDDEGGYRFEHLTPGGWLVRKLDKGLPSGLGIRTLRGVPYQESPGNCQVYEGRTTRFDFGTAKRDGCDLLGSLRLGSLPVKGWRVQLHPVGAKRAGAVRARVDGSGRFQLQVTSPGRYQLTIGGRPGGANLRLETLIDLQVGPNAWRFDHEAAQVTIEGAQGARLESSSVALRWGQGSMVIVAPILMGRTGRVVIPLPLGKVDLVKEESKTVGDPRSWTVKESFTLEADRVFALPK